MKETTTYGSSPLKIKWKQIIVNSWEWMKVGIHPTPPLWTILARIAGHSGTGQAFEEAFDIEIPDEDAEKDPHG